jgi:hypothetical protein
VGKKEADERVERSLYQKAVGYPWLLSIAHSGVADEMGSAMFAGPGIATFVLAAIHELHAALDRVYKLAMSLPEAPLVAQHQRHAVALSDAQCAQAPCGTRSIGQDLRPAAEPIAEVAPAVIISFLCRFSRPP